MQDRREDKKSVCFDVAMLEKNIKFYFAQICMLHKCLHKSASDMHNTISANIRVLAKCTRAKCTHKKSRPIGRARK